MKKLKVLPVITVGIVLIVGVVAGAGIWLSNVDVPVNYDEKVEVETIEATNIDANDATLKGELTYLIGQDQTAVYFSYREIGSSTWTNTSMETLEEPVTFNVRVTGLQSSTEYEFRAVAVYDNTEVTGDILTFTTLS